MILGYPLIVASKTLKEWKVAITSVGQGYESIKEQQDYKTGLETTYRGWEIPIDIGKSKENFKDRKPRYFNYDIYRYLAKDCKRPKKERNTRKYYKCKQVGYITKDCKIKQKMKNWNIQDTETDTEKEGKKQDFGDGPE